MKHRGTWSALVLAVVASTSCDSLTAPEFILEDFTYSEASPDVSDGFNGQAIGSQFIFVGQLRTPTRCYTLDHDLDKAGSAFTLVIEARSTRPDCPAGPGALRYNGGISLQKSGNYTLRVVHRLAESGSTGDQYNLSFTIR